MSTTTYISRLKTAYQTSLRKQIGEELKISNLMRVPKLEKITINVGLGRFQEDKKIYETAMNTLRKVTGQQPVTTKAKKSIAVYKLRAGSPVGLMVTLRDNQMYDFFDRLVTIVLPRMRDFHGIPVSSVDQRGSLHIGFIDQVVFPELSFEETTSLHGLQVSITTTATNPHEGFVLLKTLGVPFERDKEL